jgi:exoribonuclease R
MNINKLQAKEGVVTDKKKSLFKTAASSTTSAATSITTSASTTISASTTTSTTTSKQGITPWAPGVLEAATSLAQTQLDKRTTLATQPLVRAGKQRTGGRVDYRADSLTHPLFCIDASRASFYDDGFSLSPATGELLIHIADANEALRKYPILQSTAKERVASSFSPSGPLHMLPPQV